MATIIIDAEDVKDDWQLTEDQARMVAALANERALDIVFCEMSETWHKCISDAVVELGLSTQRSSDEEGEE